MRQEVYQLEAEKRQLVRLLIMKRNGSERNADISEDNSPSDQADLYSIIEDLTDLR